MACSEFHILSMWLPSGINRGWVSRKQIWFPRQQIRFAGFPNFVKKGRIQLYSHRCHLVFTKFVNFLICVKVHFSFDINAKEALFCNNIGDVSVLSFKEINWLTILHRSAPGPSYLILQLFCHFFIGHTFGHFLLIILLSYYMFHHQFFSLAILFSVSEKNLTGVVYPMHLCYLLFSFLCFVTKNSTSGTTTAKKTDINHCAGTSVHLCLTLISSLFLCFIKNLKKSTICTTS